MALCLNTRAPSLCIPWETVRSRSSQCSSRGAIVDAYGGVRALGLQATRGLTACICTRSALRRCSLSLSARNGEVGKPTQGRRTSQTRCQFESSSLQCCGPLILSSIPIPGLPECLWGGNQNGFRQERRRVAVRALGKEGQTALGKGERSASRKGERSVTGSKEESALEIEEGSPLTKRERTVLGKGGRKSNDVLASIPARWVRCVNPWLERNVEYSPGAVLASLDAYQAYFDACAGGEVVGDSEFVTAVESFFRSNGGSVQHYKGIGGGSFRNLALVTPQVGLGGQQSTAERAVSNTERAESGRAASTSASRASSQGGRKQQQGRPPRAGTASKSRTVERGRSGEELDSDDEAEWGRGVLNSLIGGQAAWLSGPLIVLASEKKNREAEAQNSALRERLRSLKESAGLSGSEGAESVKRSSENNPAVNKLGANGTVENVGEVEGSSDVETVANGRAGRASRGRKASTRQRVLTRGADVAVGRSAKRPAVVEDSVGEKESESEARFSGRESDVAGESDSEVSEGSERLLDRSDALESANASESADASEKRDVSEPGTKKVGRRIKGAQLSVDRIAELANGVSREEFLQRLEGLEKGLGTRAESLVREGLVARNGADVLAEAVAGNGASVELDGRVSETEDNQQLRAVGAGSAPGKRFSHRRDGSAANGTPRMGTSVGGGSDAWSAGPPKLDANHAVAVMVASNKRIHMLKVQGRVSAEQGDVSDSDVALLTELGSFADSASEGSLQGGDLAASENPQQNGAASTSQVVGTEGLEEARLSVMGQTEKEGVLKTNGVERSGLAAAERALQNGARKAKGRSNAEAKAGEGLVNKSAGVQGNVAAPEGVLLNGSLAQGAVKGLEPMERGVAVANGTAPPGKRAAVGFQGESLVNGAGGSLGEVEKRLEGRNIDAVSSNGRATDGAVRTDRAAPGLQVSADMENGLTSVSRSGRESEKCGTGIGNGAGSHQNQDLGGRATESVEGNSEATVGKRSKVNGTPVFLGSGERLISRRAEESPTTDGMKSGSGHPGTVEGADVPKSQPLRRAECEGARSEAGGAVESKPVLVVAGGAIIKEGLSGGVGTKPLPPPLPVVRKREGSRGMIAREKGLSSGGTADGRGKLRRKQTEQPEDLEELPMLATASHKIGEEPPIATMAVDSRGVLLGANHPPGKKLLRNYTLEEDEKLFEELGFRLTGAELGRVEEWLRTKDVPELKLSRPRDRNGRYFVMPVIEKVEKHLKAHGRLQREPEIPVVAPVTPPPKGVLTPAAGPGPQGGENTDEFFRQMSKELSADVVFQTQEQFAKGGKQKPEEQPPTEEPAVFADLFADDSSDSDVETLFAKAGLSGGEGQADELTNLERVQIAEYLMGLNGPGNDPPSKEDWPCTPDGERYSKETVRGIWRVADEMGGLDAFLTLYREEEKIERLLVETLCRGRVPKSEDWRKLDTDEKVAVERMDPEERVTALEFMIAILEEGEPLDWKRHRERWPRKMRTAHMMKSRLLLAVIKMAKRAGGLLEYLEESKKDVARKPVFPADEEAPRTVSPFRILDELLGGSDRDSNSGEDSDSDSGWRPSVLKPVRGDGRGAETDPLLVSGTAPGRVVDWRASSYLRGVDPGANVPAAVESSAGVRQTGQNGGSGRADDRVTSTGPSEPAKRYSADPDPDLDPSKIPRGFALRRRKGPPVRDNSLAFATWNTPSTSPPPPPSPVPTPPKPPIPPAQLRKGGMIRSAADRAEFLFPGDDLPQIPTPPARERRWTGIYDHKPTEDSGGPVQPQLENLSERDRELLSAPSGDEALRNLSPIERRRRRRLLGIKVQRHDDVDELSVDSGVFEVVGRQQRSMREILSGYAQETVLMRGEDLAQPVLVEDDLRSSEEGLLERLVSGHKSEVDEFKDTSKQYVRAWQDFQTWSDFFKFKNKRMPTVTDVEATCIPWLIDKAKAYVVLRKHMIMLAEGNEKLLTAMATIQAELNKRSTAPMAADRAAAYRARANLGATKKPVKRKPRAKKGVTCSDVVAGSIMDALDGSEDEFD